jgi:hypothetical protein
MNWQIEDAISPTSRLTNTMNQQPVDTHNTRAGAVTFLSIINGIAFIVTILFWGLVYFGHLIPFPTQLTVTAERANSATTYGFLVGDILWSAPLLFLATVGLWRREFWGWTAAQMVNALWVYSMTVIWMRDAYTALSPGAWLFTPFTIIAVWATYYLWNHRTMFGVATTSP